MTTLEQPLALVLRPRPRYALHVLAACVLVLITLAAAHQAQYRVIRNQTGPVAGDANDFDRFMRMVPQFMAGRADYVDDKFPTPPLTILMLDPLAQLGPSTAEFVWVCLKPVLAGLILYCGYAMIRDAGCRISTPALALIAAAWFWPIMGDIQEGQMNLLTLLPLMAGLRLAQRERPGLNWLAGVLLGLAVSIKVTPAIFILYFAWRGRWRICLAALCGMALFSIIVPAVVFGPVRSLELFVGWERVMIEPYLLHGDVVYARGESIPSFLTRLLEHVPAFMTVSGGVQIPHYMNLMDLPARTVHVVTRVVLGALLAGGAFWMRGRLMTLQCQRYLGEVGLVAIYMLWASERTWVAHYVSLILPLLAVGVVMSYPWYAPGRRRVARGALVVTAVGLLFTSDVARLFGAYGRDYVMSANLPFWGSCALLACLVSTRWVDRRLSSY